MGHSREVFRDFMQIDVEDFSVLTPESATALLSKDGKVQTVEPFSPPNSNCKENQALFCITLKRDD